MTDFYCGSCGKHKDESQKAPSTGTRPKCKSCFEKMLSRVNESKADKARRKRTYKRNKQEYADGSTYIPE